MNDQNCAPVPPGMISKNEGKNSPSSGKAKLITIEQFDYGYSIVVGCKRFAVERLTDLLGLLGSYLKEPDTVEANWLKGSFII